MQVLKKVGIVCCSNGRLPEHKFQNEQLRFFLNQCAIEAVFSKYIYAAADSVFSADAEKRAKELMRFFCDDSIDAVFDISGGDIANEILDYLDYESIKKSKKMFWGYSDLTTVINAIYAQTGKKSVLFQVKNLILDSAEEQQKRFINHINSQNDSLFDFSYKFIRGNNMSGIVVGGNIRCFLKLAGTKYFPDLKNKLLFLEAYNGGVAHMVTYINQLKQIGVFDKISGIILGTFTEMEKKSYKPPIEELIAKYTDQSLPIIKTFEIGHGADSKAIIIGKNYAFSG